MGKYISYGIGSSKKKDSYEAGVDAAKQSINQLKKIPTFSIVYTSSHANQEKIAKGINEILGTNWMGLSTDKQFDSENKYSKDTKVSILSIHSSHLHFGIGVSEDYRKDPKLAAAKASETAMKNVKRDEYVDSYMQFTRTKKQSYKSIVKTPPYFMITFLSGAQFVDDKPVSGRETEFVNGMLEVVGPHIPVFGAGAGSDFEEYLYKEKGVNYQFANGKVYKDAAIVAFVISNLYFETNVKHGYNITDRFAAITKLDSKGYEIMEINGKEAIGEYCKLIRITKKEYLKDPFKYSLKCPFGLIALDGNAYIKEALPNNDKKSFHSTLKSQNNTIMNILLYDEKKHKSTFGDIIKEAKKGKMELALFCSCSTRRLLIKNEEKNISKELNKKLKLPFFGMYNFSEIGSTKTNSAQVHGETVTSLILYDQLLTE